MFLEITEAKYLNDFRMLVSFNNGESRLFDFATIVERYPVFVPLKDRNTLKQFHISDTLEWCNGTIDIAPEYIFEHGKPVDSENNHKDTPLDSLHKKCSNTCRAQLLREQGNKMKRGAVYHVFD
ncbi:MAG: DUF2442 domain-containing protein [Bacteroidales bacterium]|nr:DUF2442 domain-containing protein [Bacteroidales bacterium]